MSAPSAPRWRAALVLGCLVVLVSSAVACAADETTTDTTTGYRPSIRTATTKRSLSKEASDEFDKAIEAARGSTSTSAGNAASSTVQSTSTTTRTSSSSSSSTTIAGGGEPSLTTSTTFAPRTIGVEECKLFVQLINFVGSLDPSIDPNDPSATAARISDPVARSAAGLDQLLAIAPSSIRGEVDKVVTWLRAMSEARETDHAIARAALDNVRSWFGVNCGPS